MDSNNERWDFLGYQRKTRKRLDHVTIFTENEPNETEAQVTCTVPFFFAIYLEKIFRCTPTDSFSTKRNLFPNKSLKKEKKKGTPTTSRRFTATLPQGCTSMRSDHWERPNFASISLAIFFSLFPVISVKFDC